MICKVPFILENTHNSTPNSQEIIQTGPTIDLAELVKENEILCVSLQEKWLWGSQAV